MNDLLAVMDPALFKDGIDKAVAADALDRSPNVKITRVVDIQGDPRVAFDTTTQIIGKERDKVDGFVCLEAQSGKGSPECSTATT